MRRSFVSNSILKCGAHCDSLDAGRSTISICLLFHLNASFLLSLAPQFDVATGVIVTASVSWCVWCVCPHIVLRHPHTISYLICSLQWADVRNCSSTHQNKWETWLSSASYMETVYYVSFDLRGSLLHSETHNNNTDTQPNEKESKTIWWIFSHRTRETNTHTAKDKFNLPNSTWLSTCSHLRI